VNYNGYSIKTWRRMLSGSYGKEYEETTILER
jgi:hypothetical protein